MDDAASLPSRDAPANQLPSLPADLSACQALLVEQARLIVEQEQSRVKLSQEIEALKLQLAKLLQQV